MKIIHTSDWHLGQEFYSYDRREEHEAFLRQLCDIVRTEQPDAMVVCGDIYHNATPSNAVMRLFTDRLDAIRQACPTMQTVVTAGNHDSSARLEVTRSLWEHLNVHVVGRIEKQDDAVDFSRHIIPIYDRQGGKSGYVVALPHVFPQNFPRMDEETPAEERQARFMQALAQQAEAANAEGLPVVMMAHMAIAGSDITGHDESRGGMGYISLSDLCVRYDYLALGHIHCPQNLNGSRARYCGSPLPVSFDERYPHSVTVAEIASAGEGPSLRVLPIGNVWPLKTLPADAVEFDEAIRMLSELPPEEKSYIRLHVRLKDTPPPNALERAAQAVRGKQCRFCCFKWERNAPKQEASLPEWDTEQLKSISPVEVARRYYRDTYGEELDESLTEMLSEAVRRTEAEKVEP